MTRRSRVGHERVEGGASCLEANSIGYSAGVDGHICVGGGHEPLILGEVGCGGGV